MLTNLMTGALCLALMSYGLPRMAVADCGNSGTTEEVMEYSQREAQAAGLETFEGGNAAGILIGVLVVVLIGMIINWPEVKVGGF